jgi:hypothetical protein
MSFQYVGSVTARDHRSRAGPPGMVIIIVKQSDDIVKEQARILLMRIKSGRASKLLCAYLSYFSLIKQWMPFVPD